MNGNSKDLRKVFKGTTSISAIYKGSQLVWGGKKADGIGLGYMRDVFSGNSVTLSQNTLNLTVPVDTTTKKFDFTIPNASTITDIGSFIWGTEVKSIVMPNLPSLTTAHNMFGRLAEDAAYLKEIDLSKFTTDNITDMESMFDGQYALTSLDLSSFDTSNVTTMAFMFSHCSALTTLDISNFDTSKVTSMYNMFQSCRSMTTLNLGNLNTDNVVNLSDMFKKCFALATVTGTISKIHANLANSDFDLSYCKLDANSCQIFINALEEWINDGTSVPEFLVSTFTYNKLSDTQKQMVKDKGWFLNYTSHPITEQ